MSDRGMSERRACIASSISRSTLRYRPVPRDDSGVITFIQDYIALNPRRGFGLPHANAGQLPATADAARLRSP